MSIEMDDIRASILKYLQTGFTSATVCYPGRDWDTDLLDIWIEPHVEDMSEGLPRTAKVQVTGLLTINIFRKLPQVEDATNNAYTATTLARVLNTLFSQRIAQCYDYVSGSGTVVGAIQFGRGSSNPMGIRESIEMVTFGVPFMVS